MVLFLSVFSRDYASASVPCNFKTYKTTKRFKTVTAKFQFKYPQVNGTSTAIKRINKDLKNEYTYAMNMKSSLFQSAEALGGANWKIDAIFLSGCKTTYNKNNGASCYQFQTV